MQALEMLDEGNATDSTVVVAAPPWSGAERGQESAAPTLPVHVILTAQPSWENILVRAGLDRESRELPASPGG